LNKYQIEVGGELLNGHHDFCLFDKKENIQGEHKYFELSSGHNLHKWKLIPIYHIYGSEELSIKNGNLRELMQKPYLAVNNKAAVENNWEENTEMALIAGERTLSLPLRFLSSIPSDSIGLPFGLEGMPFIDFDTEVRLQKIK
jgi:NADH-quinone oxidoreductase subunit G